MAQLLFKQLYDKKQRIAAMITKAEEMCWIDAEEKTDFLSKLEKDELTIGVIGQIKAGKSTFLNAFVFEDDLLPTAATPMTAALSIITYGTKKELVAEFYSQEEWQEQLRTAEIPIDNDTDEVLKFKIQAAQELIEKSSKLGSSLNSLLGKTQSDSFENLEEYVGVDGKYISITKAVTIYYPQEYLKGVKVVDTPGFNDPIVSREKRTREFLKKADVVLLLLYAEQAFTATDRSILFRNVRECGIGKVLIGINKYDISYGNGSSIENICEYVREQIIKASEEMGDTQLNDILKETEPLPISAAMALLSFLPKSKIDSNDSYYHIWKMSCHTFSITTSEEMYDRSRIKPLIDSVRQVIEREKGIILFKKPRNAILERGNVIIENVIKDIAAARAEIGILKKPNDELEEIERRLSRVIKRITSKVEGLGYDLDETFKDVVRRGIIQLEDAVDRSCHEMNRIVDEWKLFSDEDKLWNSITRECNKLLCRTLKRLCSDINQDAVKRIKRTLNDFFSDAEVILRNLPDDFDFNQRDFVKQVSSRVFFNIDNNLFTITQENIDGWFKIILDILKVVDIINPFSRPINALIHNEIAEEARDKIAQIGNKFDASSYLSEIVSTKNKIINDVKLRFVDELLTPFQKKLKEIKQQGQDRQQRLEEVSQNLVKLEKRKKEIEEQIKTIQSMISDSEILES